MLDRLLPPRHTRAMLPVIQKLLALQDRDQRLRDLTNELNHLPVERQNRESQLALAAQKLAQAEARFKQIEVEKREFELEIKTKQDAITRYRQQQLQTRKNEEYSALNHEIQAAEKVITGIEDKELVLMEEAEELTPQIQTAQKAYQDEKKQIEDLIANLGVKKTQIEAQIADLNKARESILPELDEDILDTYTRLFRSKGGQAVVAVEHEVCMGCHMKITSQTLINVKSEKTITHCPHCGRMLYLQE